MALRLLVSALAVSGLVCAQSSTSSRASSAAASRTTSSSAAAATSTDDSSDSSTADSGSGNSLCSTSATLTIQNQGDATGLAYCATYSGNIAIATGTTNTINIPTVRYITGNLIVQDAPNITSIGADSLIRVGGEFRINQVTRLANLAFPYLTTVKTLYFNALPNLQSLGFTSLVKTAGTIDIENTGLNDLKGLSLNSVQSVVIANNRFLQDITFAVTNLTGIMSIEGNGDRLSINLPNLTQIMNLTILNAPSISIPALSKLTGGLAFKNNTFDTIYAPNLTSIAGTLSVAGNTALTNMSFPMLQTIGGGLQVQSNDKLTDVGSSFPALTTISGATDSYGAFTSFKLPALKDNRGAFNLQSTGDITNDCTTFKGEAGPNSVIKGKFQCAGNQQVAGNANTTPTNGNSTKKSDAMAMRLQGAPAALGFGAVVAAVFGLV